MKDAEMTATVENYTVRIPAIDKRGAPFRRHIPVLLHQVPLRRLTPRIIAAFAAGKTVTMHVTKGRVCVA